MNGEMIMKVTMNNKIITFSIEEKQYNVIDQDGQMDLKEIYKFVKENYNYKEDVVKNIVFEGNFDNEVKNGLKFFIVELFGKFKESDFEFKS